eukprot:jgi/Bigna1/83134/fgenesh1_pg.102_\
MDDIPMRRLPRIKDSFFFFDKYIQALGGYSVRLNLADGIQCRCFVWFGELTTLKIVILLNLRYGYEKSRQYHLESRFKLCYLALMVVGIGSTLFHCTLYRSAQLMDELPMIWCVSVFLYTISPEAFSSKHP